MMSYEGKVGIKYRMKTGSEEGGEGNIKKEVG
jgi:hypothetical protein